MANIMITEISPGLEQAIKEVGSLPGLNEKKLAKAVEAAIAGEVEYQRQFVESVNRGREQARNGEGITIEQLDKEMASWGANIK